MSELFTAGRQHEDGTVEDWICVRCGAAVHTVALLTHERWHAQFDPRRQLS